MKHFKLTAGIILGSSLSFALGRWTARDIASSSPSILVDMKKAEGQETWHELKLQMNGLSQQLASQSSALQRLEAGCSKSQRLNVEVATPETENHRGQAQVAEAQNLVNQAIQVGHWTEADVAALRNALGTMTPDQRQQSLTPLLRALNDHSLKLEARVPF